MGVVQAIEERQEAGCPAVALELADFLLVDAAELIDDVARIVCRAEENVVAVDEYGANARGKSRGGGAAGRVGVEQAGSIA